MSKDEPKKHHYVPQFLLRNFSTDTGKLRVNSIAKHGDRAVWQERSIKGIGFENELYVHTNLGVPVSVETAINRQVETPISQSETWRKIKEGRSEELDVSDKPALYALVRHLSSRTPHFRTTINKLENFANDQGSAMEFSAEEREMYAQFHQNPAFKDALLNKMAAETSWQADAYDGALVMVWRSRIPLRCGTTPVISMKAPPDPRIRLDGPGTVPYQNVVSVSPTTAISLVLGKFEDGFINTKIDEPISQMINRTYIGQFAYFEQMRHVVTERDGLIEEMTWASYELENQTHSSIVFRRKPES